MEKIDKVFISDKYGKITVFKDVNEDKLPTLFIEFQSNETRICGLNCSYPDSDKSIAWGKVNKLFDSIDLVKAEDIVSRSYTSLTSE